VSLWRICPRAKEQSAVITQAGGARFPNWLALYFRHVVAAESRPDEWEDLDHNKATADIETHPARFGRSQGKVSGIPTLLIDNLRLPDCGLIVFNDEEMAPFAFYGAIATLNNAKPVIALNKHSSLQSAIHRYGYRRRQQIQGFIFYTLEATHA